MTANPTPSRPKRYSVSCCNLDFPHQSCPGEGKTIRAEGEEAEAPGRLSPAGHFSHTPVRVEIPAPLDRKGKNRRGGGAGTGEGTWKDGASAADCTSTLPRPANFPPPLHHNTHDALSGTPLSSPSAHLGGGRSTEVRGSTILHPHPQRLVPSWGQEWESRAGGSCLGTLVLPCCLRTCVSASAPAYFPEHKLGLFCPDPEIASPASDSLCRAWGASCLWGTPPALLSTPQPSSLPPLLHPHWQFPACPKPTFPNPPWGSLTGSRGPGDRPPNSRRRVATNLLGGGRNPSCLIFPTITLPPPEFLRPTPKKWLSPIPRLLFSRSKNSLQFYLMKDTFMNNQMILIKILLKDVKTSYLPTTEVALSVSLSCLARAHPGSLQTEPWSDFFFWGGARGVAEMELGGKGGRAGRRDGDAPVNLCWSLLHCSKLAKKDK